MAAEARRRVRRVTLLYSVVGLTAGLMAFEFVSGVILWLVLPSGLGWRFSSTATVLGLDRHTWIDLHNWVAVMLGAVVVVHVAMHWKWIVRQTRSYVSGRERVAES